MDFMKEMELTDKLIKQYAETHNCHEVTAADIFKLTAARLMSESLEALENDLGYSLSELENITDAINPLIHNPPPKRRDNITLPIPTLKDIKKL